MPSASNAELIVLAVYMPPHEPLPGMARRSISQKSSSLMRAGGELADRLERR